MNCPLHAVSLHEKSRKLSRSLQRTQFRTGLASVLATVLGPGCVPVAAVGEVRDVQGAEPWWPYELRFGLERGRTFFDLRGHPGQRGGRTARREDSEEGGQRGAKTGAKGVPMQGTGSVLWLASGAVPYLARSRYR